MSLIDRNRGATIRFHPAGFRVAMYKDDPGLYYDERGERVADKVAAQAGFEIQDLAREKAKKEALAAYKRKVDAEFASQEEDVERLLNADAGELTVRSAGNRKFAIYDGENRLTRKDMTKAQATELLEDMQNRGEDE